MHPEAYDWVICANPYCGKLYPKRKAGKVRKGRSVRTTLVRGHNTVTCSPECTKVHDRLYLKYRDKEKIKALANGTNNTNNTT